MAASNHEVIDSDDDGDDLSPLSSPLASPQLSPLPLPPIETETKTETTTNLAHTSTPTDPSFFRDVYEEQQRAIGAKLAPYPPGFDDSYHDILTEGNAANETDQSSRDPWEVPSSPIEVAGQQRGLYLKRKREEGGQASRQSVAAVVVQLEDLSSGNASAKTNAKKQKKTDTNSVESGTVPSIETISIPLEPLTPSRLHQYTRLLSSSINNDDPLQRQGLDLSLDMSLEAARPLQQPPYEEVLPPNESVTQSTIAFTTPSLYASSGRRAPGSSNNNNNSSNSVTKHLKSSSSHDMDIVQENEVAAVAQDATPPRRARKAADMAQVRDMNPDFNDTTLH